MGKRTKQYVLRQIVNCKTVKHNSGVGNISKQSTFRTDKTPWIKNTATDSNELYWSVKLLQGL